jgi:hypothetical protein
VKGGERKRYSRVCRGIWVENEACLSIGCEICKGKYQERCSTAELANAHTKKMGMTEFLVRGLRKVRGMAALHAIAYNITRTWDLTEKNQ